MIFSFFMAKGDYSSTHKCLCLGEYKEFAWEEETNLKCGKTEMAFVSEQQLLQHSSHDTKTMADWVVHVLSWLLKKNTFSMAEMIVF